MNVTGGRTDGRTDRQSDRRTAYAELMHSFDNHFHVVNEFDGQTAGQTD